MVALATATGAVAVGCLYLATAAGIERESQRAVRRELDRLAEAWRAQGFEALLAEVERLSGGTGPQEFAYLLSDERRVRIAGNVRRWPVGYSGRGPGDEITIEWRRADVWAPGPAQLEAVQLDRHHLLVGRDEARDAGLLHTLQVAALAGLLLATFVAVAAGLAVSRNLLGRVESMRGKIGEILGGASAERVAVGPSGDEFDELAARFNQLLDENRRLLEQVREATNNIAHDLRTPLSRMHARLEAALAAPGPPGDPRATLEALSADTDRLLDTFNGLLQIARLEGRELRRGLRPIAVAPLVDDIIDLYGPVAEEAGLALRSHVEPALAVAAERQLLGQALANLVDNALKYAHGSDVIAIDARRSRGGVEISVADRGPGIPAADRARVLDRLVRLDASRGVPGTGLGLSFVAAVARLHGGAFELEDHAPGLRAVLWFEAGGVVSAPGDGSETAAAEPA